MLAVGEKDDGAALGVRGGVGGELQPGGEVRDLRGGLRQLGGRRGLASAGMPERLHVVAVEEDELHVVLLRKTREQALFRRALEQQRLHTLPARERVELRECRAERSRSGVGGDLLFKERRDSQREAARGFTETREVVHRPHMVVGAGELPRCDLLRGIGNLGTQPRKIVAAGCGLREERGGFGCLRGELDGDLLPHLVGEILRRRQTVGQAARVGERGSGVRQIECDARSVEQTEPAGERDFAPGVHRRIGELHGFRGINAQEKLRELADDFAVVQHRPAEHEHDERDGQRTQEREQQTHPSVVRERVAAIEHPRERAEHECRADAGKPPSAAWW